MGFEWVLKCQPNVFLFWFYVLIWFWHIWPTVQSGFFNWHGSNWFRHGFRHGSHHQNWVSVLSSVVMVFGVSPAFGGPMNRGQTHNLATDFCTLMRARHALDVGYSLGSPSLVGKPEKIDINHYKPNVRMINGDVLIAVMSWGVSFWDKPKWSWNIPNF